MIRDEIKLAQKKKIVTRDGPQQERSQTQKKTTEQKHEQVRKVR